MSSSEAAPAPATPLCPRPCLQVVPNIPGRGRALVAARAIKPGEVLLVDSPLLLYPNLQVAAGSASSCSYCAHCYRTLPSGGPSFPCPGCSGQARFCSDACRTLAAASSHTPWVCHALSMLHATASHLSPPLDHQPEAFSQAAFLIAAYNLSAISPDGFLHLLSLQGDATAGHAALAIHSLVASLSPVRTGPAGFSPELTASLLEKDKMNAFGLMEPAIGGGSGERRVRAYGIYPKTSLFNHDCLPNACRFDYIDGTGVGGRNADIVVRAIHDIPEGREVCLSYFPVNWGYKERQRRLLEDYGFTCECDRCMVEKTWKDEEEEEEAAMDDEEMEGGGAGGEDEGMEEMEEGGDGDFPHAYFFVRYMCQRESCGGTLAPLAPSAEGVVSDVMECNVCGHLSRGDGPDSDGGMLDEWE